MYQIRIYHKQRQILVTSGIQHMVTIDSDGTINAHGHQVDLASPFYYMDKESQENTTEPVYENDIVEDDGFPGWRAEVLYLGGQFHLFPKHPSGIKFGATVCSWLSKVGTTHQIKQYEEGNR